MRPSKNVKTVNSDRSAKFIHLKQIAQMTLGSGDLSLAIGLPLGEELNEWLAVNSIEFFNEISILYGTLMEFCTKDSCPLMTAGQKFQYLWADGQSCKTPLKVPAPEYIDLLMNWVEAQFNNEALFPCQPGVSFPRSFMETIKTIFKRLFRVYAHIYHTHFKIIMALGLEYHLNTCFKHFIFFIDEFKLVEEKEMAPLCELIQQFKLRKEN